MKKYLLFALTLLLLSSFSLKANQIKDKCMSLKGPLKQIKCFKTKYENARKNASKTGIEGYKKLQKKF